MGRVFGIAAVVAVLALTVLGTASAGILPPSAKFHGKSLAEWNRAFFEWEALIPTDGPQEHPALREGDVDCSYAQSGKVWFLETAADEDTFRRCSVPSGTALYVPVAYWVCLPEVDGVDFPQCDEDGAFLPEALAGTSLVVDGVETKDVNPWSTATGVFDLALADNSLWELFAGTELGPSMPFSSTGAGMLLTPLPVGVHEIEVIADFLDFGTITVTYEITVTPGKKA